MYVPTLQEIEVDNIRERYREQREMKDNAINTSDVGEVVKLDEQAADVHAAMAKQLPKQVLIQTNQKDNRYLHFYKEHPVLPNALQFAGDYSFELETRFEVEPATKGSGLIHLRCLQNNKYWANSGTASNWVSAMADKPEENRSDKHCTLFQPVFVYSNNNSVLRLRHVHTGLFVTFFHGSGDCLGFLSLLPGKDLGSDVFTFINWKSVVVLPDLVRIKGDNGMYLKAFQGGFMDFQNEADNSSSFDFEVHPSRDGGIRLKSVKYSNKYWTEMGTDDIWVFLKEAAHPTVHETNTVFLPTIVVGNNRIMLRCLKNGMFCQRNTASAHRNTVEKKESCLAAFATYPDEKSYMEIVEPVDKRTVDNVIYYFKEARRYNERSFALITGDVSNRTDKCSVTAELNLKKEFTNKYTWNTGTQFKLVDKIKLTAGVPEAYSYGFEVTGTYTEERDFGEEKETKTETVADKTVVVGPMSRVKGIWTGTQLSYDVPFSYTQYDEFSNADPKSYKKYDGILTCHAGYDYKYENQPIPLG